MNFNKTSTKCYLLDIAFLGAIVLTYQYCMRNNVSNECTADYSTCTSPIVNDDVPNEVLLFTIGDLVEVYDPSIQPMYAFPAQIEQVNHFNNTVSYDILPGFQPGIVGNVPQKSIRTLKPYQENSHTVCDIGNAERGSRVVDCTVLHEDQSSGIKGGLYEVQYEQNDNMIVTKTPLSRIMRREAGVQERQTTFVAAPTPSHVVDLTSSPSNNNVENIIFKTGDLVELYHEHTKLVIPVMISSINYDTYDLVNVITHAELTEVEAKFVHPYRAFDKGAMAYCQVGGAGTIEMTPCTVVSSFPQGEKDVVYEVQLSNKVMRGRTTIRLPYHRVQRIIQ
jgi:hypothetical protein|eukprot:scaffold1230_cov201-Alexandrium_tamarense.AAC.20